MALVSVILPVFNGERFIQEAIASILSQSFTDWELIVVDDASTDRSASLVQATADARITLLHNDVNRGVVESLNRGIDHSRGTYICRMDCDDIAMPDRIEKQVRFMEDHPAHAVVGCNIHLIDERGTVIGEKTFPRTSEEIRRSLFIHNPFAHGGVMIRKRVLDYVGGYDVRFLHNEDYDLWLRIGARYPMANLSEQLLKRRIHAASITSAKETELTRYRVRTLSHAIRCYYGNPMLWVYAVRPVCAYAYRVMKGALR